MPLTAGLILAAFVDLQDYEETEQEKQETAERHAALKKAGRDPAAEDGPTVYGIIPDEVTLTGLALALPLALLLPETHWNRAEILQGWPRMNALFDAAIGAVAGGALIYGMGVFGKVAFRKEAMGLGDVKLLAMLGGLLGWKAAVMIFFIAPVFGSIFGLAMMLMTGERYARYGPFLAAAAVLVIFYEPLAALYFESMMRPGWEQPHLHHRVPFVDPDGVRRGL
jgi:Flp pilus assembly protein protease CpaA